MADKIVSRIHGFAMHKSSKARPMAAPLSRAPGILSNESLTLRKPPMWSVGASSSQI